MSKQTNSRPPQWMISFFRWFCHQDYQEDIEGDLLERLEQRRNGMSVKRANRLFFFDIIKLFRPSLMKSFLGNQKLIYSDMYITHFKIAWRTLLRNKGFTAINIAGLTLGIACCMLIFSFVNYHKSFDSYHDDSDRIYRFVTEQHREIVRYTAASTNPMGNVFREEYDLAEYVAHVCSVEEMLVKIGDENKFQEDVSFAEPDFFNILKLPFLHGDSENAFQEIGSVVLTESLAIKLFGTANAIGEVLEINGNIQGKITGVLEDIPPNSDFQTALYISYNTLPQFSEWYASDEAWGGLSSAMQCFIKLKPTTTVAMVESAVEGYPERFRPGHNNRHVYKLQSINDIHFSEQYGGVLSKSNLNALLIIGLFLLITACFNFINLATALSINRLKEVGVTKVMGGSQVNLFWRFMAETSLITIAAFTFGLIVSYLSLDYINPWLGDSLRFNYLFNSNYFIFIPILLLFVVFAAGSYPGINMARFSPIEALKGSNGINKKQGFSLRKSLIVAQFSISQLLVIGMIVMIAQLKYAQADLGFNKDAILLIPIGSKDDKMKTLKNQLSELSQVESITSCYASPASNEHYWGTSVWYENREEAEIFNIQFKGADTDYLTTFDIELVAGRNLLPNDSIEEFLVNETFLVNMNIPDAQSVIGKTLTINGKSFSGPIVGVVADFYDLSFRSQKSAICITTSMDNYNNYALRLGEGNFNEAIASIEALWTKQYPESIFTFEFLDEQLEGFYETEMVLVNVIKTFSIVAILIGCLGLFGLISFMAANRKKEIAIRKILGGTISQILGIFSSEFLKLIMIAAIIAIPIGWWAMNDWLQNFAYKITINVWVFLLAVGISAIISLITISYQSFKAATANPVDSLRAN